MAGPRQADSRTVSFIEHHALWTPAQTQAAQEVARRVSADGVDLVRLSFPDLHGILRGKALVADALPAALRSGCAITSTLLLKDTSHRTVVPIFEANAGIGLAGFEGGADVVMVPDPTTFRMLPWAARTGWMLCDLYHADGTKVDIAPRHLMRAALARLAALGYDFIAGLEVEFTLTRLLDAKMALEESGQPGSPPDIALLHHGYNYLTEQSLDRMDPILEILRRDVLALGLNLRSVEVEFGPSQCEFVFQPGAGLQPADDMILFRNAAKQICRRHGYHASFMCRPRIPNVMSSGWHLHQSLLRQDTGENAFTPSQPGALLSQDGMHFLGGLLQGACEASAFMAPTINGYRRYRANSLAPDRAAWSRDNRGALLRVIGDAGPATRIENRGGEPAANPYLYMGAQILTGMAGLRNRIEPGAPVCTPYQAMADLLPTSLDDALVLLDGSKILREGFGDALVDTFLMIKRAELARFHREVTEWEHREYFDLF